MEYKRGIYFFFCCRQINEISQLLTIRLYAYLYVVTHHINPWTLPEADQHPTNGLNKWNLLLLLPDNVSSVYTSGRKCNFKGKGCDAEHLQPINVNGWFWAGAANKRIPATDNRAQDTYWSFTGE